MPLSIQRALTFSEPTFAFPDLKPTKVTTPALARYSVKQNGNDISVVFLLVTPDAERFLIRYDVSNRLRILI
jgi:hypothetical protein